MKPDQHIHTTGCDKQVTTNGQLIQGLESLLNYGDLHTDRGVGRSYVPEVREGSYTDLSHQDTAYEEGLETYVLDRENNTFFVDDHNHALAGWIAATYEGLLQGETLLLHIDFHEDDKRPPRQIHSVEDAGYFLETPEEMPLTMEEVNSFVPELQINEFVDPALEWGLFDGVENRGLKEESSGHGYRTDISSFHWNDFSDYDSVVVDIDVDFMMGVDGKHHSYDDETVEYVEKSVARAASEADFVTWATSPGFMKHEEAVEKVRELAEIAEEM